MVVYSKNHFRLFFCLDGRRRESGFWGDLCGLVPTAKTRWVCGSDVVDIGWGHGRSGGGTEVKIGRGDSVGSGRNDGGDSVGNGRNDGGGGVGSVCSWGTYAVMFDTNPRS